MKITIIGTGYVGLVTGICLSEIGHQVTCVDIDEKKIEQINKGIPPIYEEGLEELLKKHLNNNFFATSKLSEAMEKHPKAILIAVGTPSREDGSLDIQYIESAAKDIAKNLKEYAVVIVKSTVLPGTTDSVAEIIERESNKKLGEDFGLGMNPEFLREGVAIDDFMNPDRIVLGHYDEKSKDILHDIYKSMDTKKIYTDIKTAEMIKYASNAFLAAKISLSNEIGNVAKKLGVDMYKVAEGVGADKRINPYFLGAGIGFGGSCFPKDVKALIAKAKELGLEPTIMESIMHTNDQQPIRLIDIALKNFPDLADKNITLLGLAFKANTDDTRETRSKPVIDKLLEMEAKLTVYDPKALDEFREMYGDKLKYADNVKEALENSEICFILTDWDEFKDPSLYDKVFVFDGRNVFRRDKNYEGVCW